MSKSFTRSIGEGVAGNAAYTAVVVGGSAVLAFLKVVYPEWFYVAAWVLAGCALLAVIAAAHAVWTRLPKPAPQITAENIEANIKGWLEAFRVSTKRLDQPDSIFTILATLENGIRVIIGRPKLLDRYISIQSSINFSPEDKATLEGAPLDEQLVFAAHLSVELSRTGMGYACDLEKGTILLVRRIPITGNLNEGSFMEAVDEMELGHLGALRTLLLMLHDLKKKIEPKQKPD